MKVERLTNVFFQTFNNVSHPAMQVVFVHEDA